MRKSIQILLILFSIVFFGKLAQIFYGDELEKGGDIYKDDNKEIELSHEGHAFDISTLFARNQDDKNRQNHAVSGDIISKSSGEASSKSVTDDEEGNSVDGSIVEATTDESSEAIRTEIAPANSSIDTSYTGRLLSISKSVADQCVNRPRRTCKYIKSMIQEPRVMPWAAEAETQLQRYAVAQREYGDFRLRYVECRRSLCAMEVESSTGAFTVRNFLKHLTIQPQLIPITPIFADEVNASGANIVVTFLIFRVAS